MATIRTTHSPGTWGQIVKKAFPGNSRIKAGRPELFVSTAAPDCAAKVGTLCWDEGNSNAYICTVATGTWVKINA
jgi:hypothetical protein